MKRLHLRDNDRLFSFDLRENANRGEPKAVDLNIADAVREKPKSDSGRPRFVFVPTPQDVVDKMLQAAQVNKDDVVYDLGSGDGRIVIAATKQYGCRAVGYEIDRGLVELSREKAKEAAVDQLVSFQQADLFTVDLWLVPRPIKNGTVRHLLGEDRRAGQHGDFR